MATKTTNKQIVTLHKQEKRVEIAAFELENETIFGYFAGLPEDERDGKLKRAIGIGVLALQQDRLAAFLARTDEELSVNLEHLKRLYDLKAGLFKTTKKGQIGEDEIYHALKEYFEKQGWVDKLTLTGTKTGPYKTFSSKNKTGDILAEVDGDPQRQIVIEVKLDKNVHLGKIAGKDIFKNADTAWGQLLEAAANRCAQIALIVFDRSAVDPALRDEVLGVAYYPSVGLVAIADIQRGDFTNLYVAYNLARDMVFHIRQAQYDPAVFEMLVQRVICSINTFMGINEQVKDIDKLTQGIRETLKKGLLEIEFTKQYLAKYLQDGQLSQADLYNFYAGIKVQDKYKTFDLDQWIGQQ